MDRHDRACRTLFFTKEQLWNCTFGELSRIDVCAACRPSVRLVGTRPVVQDIPYDMAS
jgi:hypothetical protein